MTDYKDEIRNRMDPDEAFSDPDEGFTLQPTDDRAVYGFPRLGDRERPTDVPLYRDSGALIDAIRAVAPGDEVRVNDMRFYPVVEPGGPVTGEGFVFETPNGTRREVTPTNPSNNPPGTFDTPWIRRVPGFDSEGELHVLEVKWSD